MLTTMSVQPFLLNDDLIQELRADLRQLQRDLTEAALAEALRLLESPCFEELTEQQVREVAEYRAIEIAGERFFGPAFSRSKEAGAMLGFARLLGAGSVRDDLTRLRGSIRDPSVAPGEPSSG
jgi:hypothetical protein